MRALAQCVSALDPDVLALSEVDAGDALAVATRFDRQWAYRGGQAVLWNRRFVAVKVHDLYLPATPLAPFERRGLLRVDGRCDSTELTLFAARFAPARACVRDLRFTRSAIRASGAARIVLFLTDPPGAGRASFGDLGLRPECADAAAADLMLAVRGCSVQSCIVARAENGIGAQLIARVTA
ncbi:MAG: endonuclease/exonuclease/phosphatase family protein [Candidatus Tumulicola sp.]